MIAACQSYVCIVGIYTSTLAWIDVFGHITDKRTPSRPLGEVKLRRAGPVVRWVTTREAPVLKALIFCLFFLLSILWLSVVMLSLDLCLVYPYHRLSV